MTEWQPEPLAPLSYYENVKVAHCTHFHAIICIAMIQEFPLCYRIGVVEINGTHKIGICASWLLSRWCQQILQVLKVGTISEQPCPLWIPNLAPDGQEQFPLQSLCSQDSPESTLANMICARMLLAHWPPEIFSLLTDRSASVCFVGGGRCYIITAFFSVPLVV